MKLEPNSSIYLNMCSHILLRITTIRHILQTKILPKYHSLASFFSVFTLFSDFVLINEYVIGNQQHCVINNVHNYHDEVEKAVADFLASKLK